IADNVPVTGVSLEEESLTLEIGSTSQLTATITPSDATNKNLIWSIEFPSEGKKSDDDPTSIATISDEGLVTAVSLGEVVAIVTSEDSEFSASAEVEVTGIMVTEVSIDQETAELNVGETLQLTTTIVPEDATDQSITWSVDFPSAGKNQESTPEEIATVDEEGLITAVSAGEVVVTAQSSNGSVAASLDVTVSNVAVTSVIISPTEVSIGVNESIQLSAAIAPENATDQSVTWSLSMEDLAGRVLTAAPTVDTYLEISEDGLLTALSLPCAGCAYKVTATSTNNQKTDQIDVIILVPVTALTVFDDDEEVGSSIENCDDIQFSVTVTPDNATDQSVTWSIEDNPAFEIDDDGLVSHIDGHIFTEDVSVTVTVSANDGSGVTAEFQNNFTIYGECH
ncbi:MAG: Ig-like domain-containing protein, partial [Reichenbachiella sp.]|uniref:Ig-like domain-containing protein n=1 Tax=Reichenbachiella sp. TaxID=2184521 RepID=UPI0032666A7A